MLQAKTKRRNRSDSKSVRSGASQLRHRSRSLRLESLEPRQMLTGTWSALAHVAPGAPYIGTMELLSDGTVLAASANSSSANTWYKLTPDATGNYVNGAWSQAASESVSRYYDATNVLQDGRVFVLGGEYPARSGSLVWTNTGDIYNPITNTWTATAPFPEPTFGGPTMLLPDGRVLAGSKNGPQTYIYDPAANTWSNGPTNLLTNDSSFNETWTKLPDGSILSYDTGSGSTEAYRLDTSAMTWSDAGTVPVALQNNRLIGPAVLLPDGQVFQVGADSNTALYDPATNTWAAGPVIPGGLGGNEAPAAMLPNGHVLFAASSTPAYGGPTRFFEFDPNAPVDSSLTDVTPATPDFSSWPSFDTRLLMLPSGQALLSGTPTFGQLEVYTPAGATQAAWQPTISTVAANGDGTFTLTGAQLNGLSAGASYGSAAEMDTNYPLVELQATDGSGHEYFARTFNWGSTGVAMGSTPETTEFSTAAFIPYGTYNLSVVANGIASAPVSFTGGVVGPSADLAIINNGPTSSTEGSSVTYSLTVTNNGPTNATNVVLTNTLGASLKYVSATKSQGTSTQSGGVVTFSFGTVAVGQTVTATVTAQSTEDGNLTNTASVTSNLPDANLNNNMSVVTTAIAEDAITVSAPITVSGKTVSNKAAATFTHASGVESASAFVATINWGDNSTSQGTITQSGATYTVKGSHTYAKNSTYTVTTTVVEAGTMSPNFAMASSSSGGSTTSGATTSTASATAPTASSSTAAPPISTAARDAVFASAAGVGATAGPSVSTVNLAGAQPVVDTGSLDALFELLNGLETDALHLGKSNGLLS